MPTEVIYEEDGLIATTTVIEIQRTREIEVASAEINAVRKVRAVLKTDAGISFFYGAQAGEGGIIMEENSRIEGAGGVAGNIYSNGPVTGDQGATITGDVTVATGIAEDNQARSTVCNQDQVAGQTSPQIDFAQSFQPSETKTLSKASLYIKKVGSPQNATVRIAVNNNGSPAQNDLMNGTLAESLVGSNYSWVEIIFSNPVTLTGGATYWIVVDAKKDANKYWVWCKDSNQGYGNGAGKYSDDWDDDPWAAITGDLAFKTFFGTGVSLIDTAVVYGDARAHTITSSQICGDAYYQSIDASSVSFLNDPSGNICSSPLTSGTGFADQPDPPVQNMPISEGNIQDWKDEAEAGGIIQGDCGDSGSPACVIADDGTITLGPKKINGNLVLTKKQTLIVYGTLYFTGSVSTDSGAGATIRCAPSYGEESCVLITDSWVHIKNNMAFAGSGEEGSYILMLSALDNCRGGDQQPQCTHHNGAIDLHNNATGAIFYTADSLINLHNGVNVTEATAYALRLDNNAIITYENGLINALFSAGPSGGWSIDEWREIE